MVRHMGRNFALTTGRQCRPRRVGRATKMLIDMLTDAEEKADTLPPLAERGLG
jgi:hypothetical protein